MRCPRRPYLDNHQQYNAILTSYKMQQQGFLTEQGTWLDQPAMLTRSMEILDVALADAKEKQEEGRAQKERARSAAQHAGGKARPAAGATGGRNLPGRG